mmetsp:Transcript_124774/g.216377  ORF Transcript_124774/g.216377 Transcript_124774/m.216377 type:complete len:399 (+) Transcript_124774:104-1300(+)
MSTYWLVATGYSKSKGLDETTAAAFSSALKSRIKDLCEPAKPPCNFDVPVGENALKFGSFDDLIRLTDELQKYDSQVESVIRRLERLLVELDPNAGSAPMETFKVLSQRQWYSFDKYIATWKWDEAKYPKMRGLSNNLNSLLTTVNQLDEAARNKTTSFNELKSQQGNIAKKDSGSLVSRDLIDILTPENIVADNDEESDFVETEYLTTVILVVQGGATEKFFLDNYEYWSEKVLPMSAKKLADEEGYGLWRVICFKSAAEAFKKKARDEKYVVRDFTYSAAKYDALQAQREELKKEYEKMDKNMKGFCKASWSDCMVAWVHIKAMRVFVESVLRYGVPPKFVSYLIQPKPSTTPQLRTVLADTLGGGAKSGGKVEGEDEDYYPYVSLSFTPFSTKSA